MPLLFFHFPLTIFNLNCSIRATWLREGAGGKPARAAAAGDAAAKKRACKLFLWLAASRLPAADL